MYFEALNALQKPRSKIPAIVPEVPPPPEQEPVLEDLEADGDQLIDPSTRLIDPSELSEQQREAIELQEQPAQSTEVSEPELPFSPGIRRPGEELEEPQAKALRIDPDSEVPSSPSKVQRISALWSFT